MSQQQHTQEPWRANDAQADIDGPNGEPVAVCYCNDESGDDAKENARRIVACVNACAGIQTEQLESVIGKLAISSSISMWQSYCDKKMQLEDAIEQRDTLLAALEKTRKGLSGGLWDYGPGQDEHDKCNHLIAEIDAAIASVKEQA